MNVTEIEIRKKYRYSSLSYVFDVYMECEFRANLTQNKYEGLDPGEFRFDYKSWGNRLNLTKKQMERAMKELTIENTVIAQVEKGTRGTSSKYFLARLKENNNASNINALGLVKENKTEEKKKEHNKENEKRTIGEEKNSENTGVEGCVGEQKGNEKEKKKEKKKEQSSQHIHLNIISNIYSHWNSKNIITHKLITKEMEKAIEKNLKLYSEDEIINAIDTYDEVLESEFYFSYKWTLADFLNRKNGISTFMDEGKNKVNYQLWKKDGEQNANTRGNTFRNRGCFNEGAEKIEIELPKREHRHYTNEELAEFGID